MTANISVLSMERLGGDRPTKAICSVQAGGITINDVKVIDAGKGAFVAMPSAKGRDDPDWHDVVVLSKPLAKAVREVVLRAFRGEPSEGEDAHAPSGEARTTSAPRSALHRAGNGKPRGAIQQHIDELARRFDERGPDTEIPF